MNRGHIYRELNTTERSLNTETVDQNLTMQSDITNPLTTKEKNKKNLQINHIKKKNIFPTKSILLILLKLNLYKIFIIIFVMLLFIYYIIFWRESHHVFNNEINLQNSERIKMVLNKCRIYFLKSERAYNYIRINEIMIINETISLKYFRNGLKTKLDLYYNPRQTDEKLCKIEFFFLPNKKFKKNIDIRCDSQCFFFSRRENSLSFSNLKLRSIKMDLRLYNIYDSVLNINADILNIQMLDTKKNVVLDIKSRLCLAYIFNTKDILSINYKLSQNDKTDIISNYAFTSNIAKIPENKKNEDIEENKKIKENFICLKNKNDFLCKDNFEINFDTDDLVLRFYTKKNAESNIDKILENLKVDIIFLKTDEILKLIVDNIDKEDFVMKINIFHLSLINKKSTQLFLTKNFDLIFIKKFLRFQSLHYAKDMRYFNFYLEIITNADQFDLEKLTDSQKIVFYKKLRAFFLDYFKNFIFNENYKLIYINNKLDFDKLSVNGQNAKIYIPSIFYFFYFLYFISFFLSIWIVIKAKKYLKFFIKKNNKNIELNLKINNLMKNNFLMVNIEEILNFKHNKMNKNINYFSNKIKTINEVYKTNHDYYYFFLQFIFDINVDSFSNFLNAVSFKEKKAESYLASEKIFKIDFEKFYKKYKIFCLRKNYKIAEPDDFKLNESLEKIGYTIEESLNEFNFFITNIKILNFENSGFFNEVNIFDNNDIFDSLEFFIKNFCRKTMFSENKISLIEFIEIYDYYCERFFLGKKIVDISVLIENYDFEIVKKFKKYIIQEEMLNTESYYFDFFFLDQYLESKKKIAKKKNKTKFFLETLIFKKEEKK